MKKNCIGYLRKVLIFYQNNITNEVCFLSFTALDHKMTEVIKKLKLVVFLGSNREGRLGSRVKSFVLDHLQAKKKYDIVVYGMYMQSRRWNSFLYNFLLSAFPNSFQKCCINESIMYCQRCPFHQKPRYTELSH